MRLQGVYGWCVLLLGCGLTGRGLSDLCRGVRGRAVSLFSWTNEAKTIGPLSDEQLPRADKHGAIHFSRSRGEE